MKDLKKALALGAAALLLLCLCLSLSGCGAITMAFSAVFSDSVHVYEDVSEYGRFAGPEAEQDYLVDSYDLRGDIFPAVIPPEAEATEFKMVYYNPFDPQWLCYLTLQYDADDYAQECERLAAFPKADYAGVFSVTGFPEEPLAVSAGSSGFLYAIPTPGRSGAVTYVRLEFHNYFYDLDYRDYIPEAYLPLGFDATEDNPYRKACLASNNLGVPHSVDAEAYAEYEQIREEVLKRCESLDAAGLAAQPEAVASFYRADAFWTEYSCGGIFGYFANPAGKDYGPELLEDLDRIGASEHRAMLERFLTENGIDLRDLSEFRWSNMNKLSERIDFADFDYRFAGLRPLWELLEEYARENDIG